MNLAFGTTSHKATAKNLLNTRRRILGAYVVLVIVFSAIVLFPAPDHTTLVKYHLSALAMRLILLTLIIPEAAIWFAAFYGSYKLQRYSQLIKGSEDGRHIARLAHGLLLLAIGLPTAAIVGGTLSIIAAHNPGFTATSTVISNYLSIVFPLLAFVWISRGAWGLSELSKARPSLRIFNLVVIAALLLGIIFCCLIVLDHTKLRATYHMSPELVMLTLGVPYIYMWFLGLFSVAELREYSRTVRGIVYRKGWRQLISGIASIIVLSIALQYLGTLSTWLTSLSLAWLLLLLYVLLLLLTGAYIVVALGAQRLTNIEEV